MTFDWIPNLHPFIVHFPIALLVVAVLFDAALLFFKKQSWLHKTVLALYTTGTLGLIAAFLSGRQAVDTVSVTGDAIAIVTSHEDWALYTLIYFSFFTLLRGWTWWKSMEDKKWVLPGMVVLAVAGTGMLWNTGEKGAKLVYKYGVAVGEIDRMEQQIEGLRQDLALFREEAAPEVQEDGSWVWRIGPGAAQALRESFTIEGSQNVTAELGQDNGRYHIELSADSDLTYFVTGNTLSSIEGRIEFNSSDFEGSVLLVHHYRNPDNYQYLKLEGDELDQGQIINGTDNLLGSGTVDPKTWNILRVTTNGQHYYGYHNQQTVVHTHSDELEPGKTGIALSGEGVLRIRLIEFSSVN